MSNPPLGELGAAAIGKLVAGTGAGVRLLFPP